MKNTTSKAIMSDENVRAIEGFLDESERLKGSYFWGSQGNAASRRNMEAKRGWEFTKIEVDGHKYSFEITVDCSCAHVYVHKTVTKDGYKTTITVLKTLLKKHYEAIKSVK